MTRTAGAVRTKGLIVATATRKLEDSLKTKSWFVRNEQGETFGPVDFETLKAWASDGRLAPTNEVSENGTEWVFATSLGGLAMDWVAEVTPGTFYGPIHKVAMEELVKDGSIAARAPFFMRYALSAKPAPAPDEQQAEQVRKQLTAQLEQAEQQAALAAAERRKTQQQAAAQAEQAKQQMAVAAAELGKARQQAAQAEQAKQQAALVAAELEKARQQLEAQIEQARAAQQQMSAKSEEQGRQLTQARQEQAAAALRLAELKSEVEARGAAWAAKERASEAERQSLRSAKEQALAESATRMERVKNLEIALAEAGRAAQEGHAVETQVQVLRSELAALRAALEEERQTSHQSKAQSAALAASLEEAKLSRTGDTQQVSELRSALAQARQQVEGLRAVFRQAESMLGTQPAPTVVVETLEAEPMEKETRPPVRPKQSERPVFEAEVLSPERPKPADKPPVANPANQSKPGLSMADLEQQARRELERLGSHGSSFFKKKK